MQVENQQVAIAVYREHSAAEAAVKALHRAGFDMKKISIVGKGYETDQHVIGFLNVGDRARMFGKLGAFWGGLVGLLFGSAVLFVPVVGHFIVLGPLALAIFDALEGAVEGAVIVGAVGALAGALTALGIPKDSVLCYETQLKANKYLLVVQGDAEQIQHARELLKASGSESLDHYAAAGEAAAA